MKIPLSWLKEYVDINVSVETLAEEMTLAGLEVTGIERIGETWDRDTILVGRVIRVEPHPNADRLTMPTVEYGGDAPITLVTGAPNIRVGESGMKVAVALAGARLIDGHSDTRRMITLKPSKLRGVESAGMVCSELELGISDEHEGIMELPADAPVGVPLADYMGDVVFELDLTPNLSRCFSMIGVAREVAAILRTPLHIAEPVMDAAGPPIDGQVELEILDPDLCNRYTGALIKGVEIKPSPAWMQRRLTLAGMRPINNIVDITNYVMLEWGQPLHAFDYHTLRPRPGVDYPPAIIVRRAAAGEKMTTLDNVSRVLTDDVLLITDGGGPVALAGVMGGLESEITENTRDILLEAANFNFINNRRTSKTLRLISEASIRFGRGIPASRTEQAARRAAQLMRDLAGGEIAAGLADAYPVPQQPVTVTLAAPDVERVIGIALSTTEIIDILSRLEFTYEVAGDTIQATVPEHRLDVTIPADVLEEIARVYGYGRIPVTLMQDELPTQRHNDELEVEEALRDILAECGLQEVISYSVSNLATEGRVTPGEELLADDYIHLANPISSERATLRQSLMGSLLSTAAGNLRNSESVKLFEIAAVYLPVAGQLLPDQPRRLGIVMTGPRTTRNWSEAAGAPIDFFDLKGIIETALAHLGIGDVAYEPATGLPFAPGRAASLLIGGVNVGQLGEVHPLTKDRFELPEAPVCLAEIDLEQMLAGVQRVTRVQPISRYPGVSEDLAVVVDESVTAEQVRQAILKTGGQLLAGLELFDIYRGDQIPAGKKSLAFSLHFLSVNKTLTDGEVRFHHQRIVKQLEKDLGARLRA
jgi:phenylalanyl-tRNA synthetase beta chain